MEQFKKGDKVKFLDYTIKYCTNGDGIVLMKEGRKAKGYECHLGNFSTLESAQIAAVLFFMIARPEDFSTTVFYRTTGTGGQLHEYGLFKSVLEKEGLEMPVEISPGDGINMQVYLNGKELHYNK